MTDQIFFFNLMQPPERGFIPDDDDDEPIKKQT